MGVVQTLRDKIGRTDRDVAQPGSAPASGAGGRRFKSSHPDHLYALLEPHCRVKQWGFLRYVVAVAVQASHPAFHLISSFAQSK